MFLALFGVKTLSETLFPPPLMKAGNGTRWSSGEEDLWGTVTTAAPTLAAEGYWNGTNGTNFTYEVPEWEVEEVGPEYGQRQQTTRPERD